MRRVSIVTERGVGPTSKGEGKRRGSGGVDRARIGTHRVLRRVHVDAIHPRASGAGAGGREDGRGGDGPRAVSPRVRPRGGVGGRQTPGRAGHIRPGAPARIRFDGVAELGVCAQVAGSTSVTGLMTLKTLKSDVSDGFFAPDFKNNGGSRRFFRCYSRDMDDCSLVRLKRKTPN